MSKYRDPWECRDADVVSGTSCLPNTSGRCTWCGRILPKASHQVLTARQRERISSARVPERVRQAGRQMPTDPIEFLDEGVTSDYWTLETT